MQVLQNSSFITEKWLKKQKNSQDELKSEKFHSEDDDEEAHA